MWVQISVTEAADILISGGKVDDGFYRWGGTLKLRHPEHWRKSRKRKALKRKLAGRWNCGDGWWVHRH